MRPGRHRLAVGALMLGLPASGLYACDGGEAGGPGRPPEGPGPRAGGGVPELELSSNLGQRVVPVDAPVERRVAHGTLRRVVVSSPAGRLAGRLAGDRASWQATDRLEPGLRYRVRTVAEDVAGKRVVRSRSFRTQPLTLDQQTYPSVAPLVGETVGVGMPVVVTFDLPVTDRAAFERHMEVTAQPAQPGAWHWLSGTEAHWRPQTGRPALT